ncbi:XRE family transcriptional regulator [Pantoea stewartii]|uniref:XRE family transcriptional regulator n=1 Tax=Pantoea TaxID=53335 RepID=UPI000B5A322F|nr:MULTISPECIES: XRE family transcriptional regulator [Pantoea]MDF7788569.1 XRE family transcriptional regulator [Pantoea stewartii]OWY74865.1 XRE family transcriptional regulator [Pantoea sp. AMG 501]
MDENDSVGRFLASLLAEYDMSLDKFCRRSGLQEHEVRFILRDERVVTPAVAENLGRVFYSPGFWMVRQAMSELSRLTQDG